MALIVSAGIAVVGVALTVVFLPRTNPSTEMDELVPGMRLSLSDSA
jgi:hypothetical protein